MDWETKVVRRIARHVSLLPGDHVAQVDASNKVGWERAALVALRRRMRGPESG